MMMNQLWFAFIFVSLQSLRQRRFIFDSAIICCDLLLFSYLCKVLDNDDGEYFDVYWLWFAFIFVSLQSLRQRTPHSSILDESCDLLLFSYLCKVLDNYANSLFKPDKLWFAFIFVSLQSLRQLKIDNAQKELVVICFYFRIFAKS